MKPQVSVILPTYNRAKLLQSAIDSVLNQTYRNLELIIIDDASTDNTEELIKRIKQIDGRIKYVKCKKTLAQLWPEVRPLPRTKIWGIGLRLLA